MAGRRMFGSEMAKAPEGPRQGFDPSTWGGQARSLARNDADAVALLLAGGLAALDVLIIWAALRFGWAETRDVVSGAGLELLGVQVGVVLVAWVLTYALSLRQDTQEVRETTWRREVALGEDLDGDGVVGEPQPASRKIRVNHQDRVEEITLDMPARSTRGGPVLVDFGVTAADLVAFLFEADLRRGLQERNWLGREADPFTLPSGQRVTQAMFRQIVAGLGERGMAIKTAGRWELDCDPGAVAEQLAAGDARAV